MKRRIHHVREADSAGVPHHHRPLAIEGSAKATAFYEKAFGAELIDKAMSPDGTKVWHASLKIGDSIFVVNDTMPEMGVTQSHSSMWLYVTDCDGAFTRGVVAGATAQMPPADMFWGDRMGNVVDPFGQRWTLARM